MPSLDSLLLLLVAIAGTALLAPRLRMPLPIALTAVGLALALVKTRVPGLPVPHLEPNLILLVLLPPLLYADAFQTSWHDVRRWIRPIVMLAVGLVAVTILTVGLAAHWLFPELPLVVCFALGAILSPTDTVATQAVLQRLRIPRRATAILGGESLVNDGTGLVGVQICGKGRLGAEYPGRLWTVRAQLGLRILAASPRRRALSAGAPRHEDGRPVLSPEDR
jgi:CPA1 family monovalent cation:H+ antiporter